MNVRFLLTMYVSMTGLSVTTMGCFQDSDREDHARDVAEVMNSHFVGSEQFLVINRPLRFAPTDAERVSDPYADGDMNNWIGNGWRGDKLKVLKQEGQWIQVRVLPNGGKGWVPLKAVLAADKVVVGAMLETIKHQSHTISQGGLIFVLEQVGDRTRITVGDGQERWVDAELVTTDAVEVEVAKNIVLAKGFMAREQPQFASRLLDKIRVKYPQAKLLQALANHLPFRALAQKPTLDTAFVPRKKGE